MAKKSQPLPTKIQKTRKKNRTSTDRSSKNSFFPCPPCKSPRHSSWQGEDDDELEQELEELEKSQKKIEKPSRRRRQ